MEYCLENQEFFSSEEQSAAAAAYELQPVEGLSPEGWKWSSAAMIVGFIVWGCVINLFI